MCIVFIYHSNDKNSKYKLILAANRDEYLQRPAKPVDFHPDFPNVLCGLDMETGVEGGTWLGVSKSGKFSALTNVLMPNEQDPTLLPRGKLVIDYLKGDISYFEYLNSLQNQNHREYNLLTGGIDVGGHVEAGFYSNCDDATPRPLKEGTNVISCTKINGAWKKIKHGRNRFDEIISTAKDVEPEVLTDCILQNLLSDNTCLYPDDDVKNQCKGKLSEAILEKYCSVMISGLQHYGTRMQTVVLIDRENNLYFTENSLRGYGSPEGTKWIKKSFNLNI